MKRKCEARVLERLAKQNKRARAIRSELSKSRYNVYSIFDKILLANWGQPDGLVRAYAHSGICMKTDTVAKVRVSVPLPLTSTNSLPQANKHQRTHKNTPTCTYLTH